MRRPSPSRRETLVGAAATVAACSGPSPTDTAPAPEAATIDTIIFVMMENRSFDHYLGGLTLAEGRTDVDGVTAEMSNPDSDGVEHVVAPATLHCVADPGHSWGDSHSQFNDGANDGFVVEYEGRVGSGPVGEVMSYQLRANIPITHALADAYTVCDRWFCSVMGPTWPNRFFAHAGSSDGQTNNDFPEGGAFTFQTLWSTLDEAGIAWKYYYTDVPYIGLFEGAFRSETTAYLEDFVRDAERGDLPPVVWIDPGFSYNDDHPPHHPGLGQEFLAIVYDAIAKSPQWGRCLLVITYDEHGGFFDHVAPPTTDDDRAADGFDQLGFRVPTLIIGPYVRPGADHTVFDHTSWLKYVCERFDLTPWTARIRAANSIGAVLDTDRMSRAEAYDPITLPAFDIDDASVGEECGYGGPPSAVAEETDLERWVRQNMPKQDRTATVAAIMAELSRARRAR